jgi:adenosylhomocysteine/aminodeoxyfutalosine nucleosidase
MGDKTIIGIIGAMKEEVQPLLEHYEISEEIKINDIIFYKVELENKILYIVRSKIGKVYASMTATLLITKFNCDKILFTGVAGAVDDCLEIGDIVISDKLVQHDFDVTEFGHAHGYIPEAGIYFDANKDLQDIAEKVSKENNINYKIGGIATGDQFVNCSKRKNFIKEKFNSLALEMEGGAVAQIAQYFGVDFLVLRSISDKAEGGANIDFQEFVKKAAINSSKILIGIVEKI